MQHKNIKQTLHYNSLLLPKDHREVIQNSNFSLWNDITAINTNFPNEEIRVDHIVKDFGKSYGIDLKLTCDNPAVQKQLDDAYERKMRLPRFNKHESFYAMIGKD